MSDGGKTNWRAKFGPGEVIQRVRPAESRACLGNPHKGTATFQRFNGDELYPGLQWNDREGPTAFRPFDGKLRNRMYPQCTIAYCRWLWSVIEPEKGVYRWDYIDGSLEAARLRGQTLQVRIQPYIGDDAPAWYWEAGASSFESNGRRHIDHNDPLYEKHWGEFLRAFAARYDGHPDLESFDVAYGGPCGETGGNTSDAVAERLADIYLECFTKTQLVLMLGTHGCAHAARTAGRKLGWRADCLGDMRTDGRGEVPDGLNWNHMYDAYPREVVRCGVADAWRSAPVTLETCWTVGYWRKQGWDIDWILEQGLKYRPSVFMPKSSFIPADLKEKIDEFGKRIGYRFVLRQMALPLEARAGQEVCVQMFIDNVGVAPIYRPYRLAYGFAQGGDRKVVFSGQDIRSWMPDHTWFEESIAIPSDLRPGEARVDVGIVDRAGAGKVRFAIDETLDDLWHPLTMIDVL